MGILRNPPSSSYICVFGVGLSTEINRDEGGGRGGGSKI